MSAQAFVGIDIGTFGSKGVLVATDGKVVATATRSHDIATPRPGWAEQDADAVWWADFCALAHELRGVADRQQLTIAGVGASAIGPTCLPVDEHGTPLRSALLYGIDARAGREITELDAELGADRILEVCGSPLTSQAVGPKVRWLQRHEPEVWARTAHVLTAHSYLAYRLTGRYVVDAYSAAAQVPFFDLRAGRWAPELVEPILPLRYLPEIFASADVVGAVHAQAAEQSGLPSGTPVVVGAIDAAAEALAAGVHQPGDMMVMYGTTAFFVQVVAQPVVSPRLWAGVWLDGDHAVLTGGMSTTGAITEWLRRELTDIDDREAAFRRLFEEADGSRPGANGLLVLPYWSGERTPINEPRARGIIAGLSLTSTRGDVLRAVLEATGLGVRHHLEVMAAAGAPPTRLVAIGGGARSRTWLQAVSDITGMAQDVPRQAVGAAYGDALLAAVGTGVFGGLAEAASRIEVAERIEPNPELADLYDRRYAAYRELFAATRTVVLALQDEQDGR